MKVLRYLGFAFLMVWLLAAAPMLITVAETAVQAPDPTPLPAQPTQGEELQGVEQDLLNSLD